MFRINQSSNEAAKTYYGSPAEYYRDGEQEVIGEWIGKGAGLVGLESSTVLQRHFARLCDNCHPFTGEQMTARMRKDRRVGYDFNFHVCKSLSILYAVTGDPGILEALRWAVRETLRALERDVRVRVRKGGRYDERIVANLIAAEFIHFTARPVGGVIDPHLHIHCFIPNICWDHVEKAWKAIDVASIKADAPEWQDLFQRLLADRIGKLGYAVVWKGRSWEIDGISRDMIERFSGRTMLINRTAEKRGITDPREKDQIGPRTRERKRKEFTMPHLHGQWRERLTPEDRAAIGLVELHRRRPSPDGREREAGPAWQRAAEDAARRGSRHPVPGQTQANRQQRLGDHIMQRQRLAAHEQARASAAAPGPRRADNARHQAGLQRRDYLHPGSYRMAVSSQSQQSRAHGR